MVLLSINQGGYIYPPCYKPWSNHTILNHILELTVNDNMSKRPSMNFEFSKILIIL